MRRTIEPIKDIVNVGEKHPNIPSHISYQGKIFSIINMSTMIDGRCIDPYLTLEVRHGSDREQTVIDMGYFPKDNATMFAEGAPSVMDLQLQSAAKRLAEKGNNNG